VENHVKFVMVMQENMEKKIRKIKIRKRRNKRKSITKNIPGLIVGVQVLVSVFDYIIKKP